MPHMSASDTKNTSTLSPCVAPAMNSSTAIWTPTGVCVDGSTPTPAPTPEPTWHVYDKKKETHMSDTDLALDDVFLTPTCWWTIPIDSHEWAEKVEELRPFVTAWARLNETPHSVIPPCWDQHPSIILLLGTLRDVALSVEDMAAMPIQSRDIIDMWTRIKTELSNAVRATGGCDSGRHHARPARTWWSESPTSPR